jgi:hypothetical protein
MVMRGIVAIAITVATAQKLSTNEERLTARCSNVARIRASRMLNQRLAAVPSISALLCSGRGISDIALGTKVSDSNVTDATPKIENHPSSLVAGISAKSNAAKPMHVVSPAIKTGVRA